MDAFFLYVTNALYTLMPIQNIFTLILFVIGLVGLVIGFKRRTDAGIGTGSSLSPDDHISENSMRVLSTAIAFLVGLLFLRFMISAAPDVYFLLSRIQETVLIILLLASSLGVWTSYASFPSNMIISQERLNKIGEILFPNISDHATRLHELFVYGYTALNLVSMVALYALMVFYGRTVNFVPFIKVASRLAKMISRRFRTV
jgi:hypothetical protein